ncbi:hypothetical protein GWI33_001749 [Rhynchophorus ferrugineus]|uniref:Uncharacterized protein n=1 Tax=Rhynchophorus ferrugineus TaxID=354439 RepID=A0A834IL16_RHYFE|nr:hypothetical protein GWI33_001749 [Rhynchophorus ferrugineus]
MRNADDRHYAILRSSPTAGLYLNGAVTHPRRFPEINNTIFLSANVAIGSIQARWLMSRVFPGDLRDLQYIQDVLTPVASPYPTAAVFSTALSLVLA